MGYDGMSRRELIARIEQLKARMEGLELALAESQSAEGGLRALAHADQLTGLYNRGTFFTLALQQLRLAARHRRPLLLLYCDVRGLGRINEAFGLHEGDRALVATAELLRGTFRESDVIARVGPDEFAVLAVEASEGQGEALVERLERGLAARNARTPAFCKLDLAVGLASWDPDTPCSVTDLLRRAVECVSVG
jgi:diguanylate cyclase (GGDEF)-like protein